jgi:hypothetical protein
MTVGSLVKEFSSSLIGSEKSAPSQTAVDIDEIDGSREFSEQCWEHVLLVTPDQTITPIRLIFPRRRNRENVASPGLTR